MSIATAPLPETIDELRAFAALLQNELYAKTLHIEKLKGQLAVLKRARFGRSSEKLDSEIEQMELLLGDLEEDQAEGLTKREASTQPVSSAQPPKQKPVRKPLPEHLPRERVEHEAACVCPACGSTRMTRIGTDEREVLEYIPSHFKVIVHARPKMSCRDCETITQEPMLSLPIVKGMPGPGLLAHVLVSKYCDHLPLYRQSTIYAREGMELDRSTLAEWIGAMSALLTPVAEAIACHVRAAMTFHADETPVPVLEPGRGKTRTGRLWALVRDERPFGSVVPPAVCYRYSPNRKAEHAEALLKDCHGYLHADAYTGFDRLYDTPHPRLMEVSCWAHARRKIYEVHAATQSEAAHGLLEQIGRLFEIERTITGMPPDHRKRVRQEQSVPLLETLRTEMETVLSKISQKSTLAQAIRYATSRWPSLTRYTTDGRLEMTNNAAERAMRPIALGRKNYLFAGSDTGGIRAATIYTLIETAKMNGINPESYLRDIIARIADHPINRIQELLPWRWKQPKEDTYE